MAVELKSIREHCDSGCQATFSTLKQRVGEILGRSQDAPTTETEKKVACNIIKRMMSSAAPSSYLVSLPT